MRALEAQQIYVTPVEASGAQHINTWQLLMRQYLVA